MKRTLRNGITVLLAAVFVISGALVLQQICDERAAKKAYEAAQELAAVSTPGSAHQRTAEQAVELTGDPVPMASEPAEPLEESAQFLLELELDALRQTNDRVLGWICIPDSKINYPLLMVKDNNEYLRRAWDGSQNSAGCIFLECKNQSDLSDFNTLIYGHYMRNGTMFGSLKYYAQEEYWESHPFVYIVTDDSVYRYEVFSAYEANITSDTYRLYFEDDVRRQSALDHYIESSVLETRITPAVEDHILTLSTCTGTGTYDTRWVVQAVLTGEFSR